jgi:hypothetical protein
MVFHGSRRSRTLQAGALLIAEPLVGLIEDALDGAVTCGAVVEVQDEEPRQDEAACRQGQ